MESRYGRYILGSALWKVRGIALWMIYSCGRAVVEVCGSVVVGLRSGRVVGWSGPESKTATQIGMLMKDNQILKMKRAVDEQSLEIQEYKEQVAELEEKLETSKAKFAARAERWRQKVNKTAEEVFTDFQLKCQKQVKEQLHYAHEELADLRFDLEDSRDEVDHLLQELMVLHQDMAELQRLFSADSLVGIVRDMSDEVLPAQGGWDKVHRLWRDYVGIRPRYAGWGALASRWEDVVGSALWMKDRCAELEVQGQENRDLREELDILRQELYILQSPPPAVVLDSIYMSTEEPDMTMDELDNSGEYQSTRLEHGIVTLDEAHESLCEEDAAILNTSTHRLACGDDQT
ncbi:hypothetical protein Bbelb_030760 [Branchiostoma belcheri]|nr:hypothetical protein Bbelb_030760 [Branchiostoma belcheri]